MLNCVVFLAMLGLTFVAGWQTAKRKGTAASGSIAGLIAGVIGELVGGGMTIAVILLFVSPQLRMPTNSYLTLPQAQALLIGATIFGVVVGVLLAAGCGAGMGALGGLVGANTYRQRMTQAQAAAQAAAQTRGQPPMYLGMPDQP
ncbi:MAG: hypothetical protein KGO05_07505 [Chloroflexota bacterium]|nr:hypothetical protein [Chloroflexota bacterium]